MDIEGRVIRIFNAKFADSEFELIPMFPVADAPTMLEEIEAAPDDLERLEATRFVVFLMEKGGKPVDGRLWVASTPAMAKTATDEEIEKVLRRSLERMTVILGVWKRAAKAAYN